MSGQSNTFLALSSCRYNYSNPRASYIVTCDKSIPSIVSFPNSTTCSGVSSKRLVGCSPSVDEADGRFYNIQCVPPSSPPVSTKLSKYLLVRSCNHKKDTPVATYPIGSCHKDNSSIASMVLKLHQIGSTNYNITFCVYLTIDCSLSRVGSYTFELPMTCSPSNPDYYAELSNTLPANSYSRINIAAPVCGINGCQNMPTADLLRSSLLSGMDNTSGQLGASASPTSMLLTTVLSVTALLLLTALASYYCIYKRYKAQYAALVHAEDDSRLTEDI